MNRKAFTILVLIAGICVILAIVGQGRVGTGSIAGDLAGTVFLPRLGSDVDTVEQILVAGGARQRLVSLELRNNDWMVAELGGYPVERNLVNTLLIALAEARIVEEKTANPEFHARLGVEEIDAAEAAGLEITLVTEDSDRYAIVLGHSYAGSQRYARFPESNQSLLIDRNPEIPRNPSDWVATNITDVAADRVQRVEIAHADGERLVIQKEARGDDNFSIINLPAGRELQYAGVANVTGNVLENLNLEDVSRRPEADPDAIVVSEFWTFDGLVVEARSTTTGDANPWLHFSARFDADQALTFATGPADDIESAIDVIAEADRINTQLADWRYRIASYQTSQLTRRMEDLLQAEVDE